MSVEYDICRSGKAVTFQSCKDGLTIHFKATNSTTGKTVGEHILKLVCSEMDLLANALVNDTLFSPNHPVFTIRMQEHYLSVSVPKKKEEKDGWVSRVVSCNLYEKGKVISMGLSPVECYQLNRFCDRVALVHFMELCREDSSGVEA